MTIDPRQLAADLGFDPTNPDVTSTCGAIAKQLSIFADDDHPCGRRLILKRPIMVLPDTLPLTEARRWFNEGRCSYEEVLAFWPRWAVGKTEYRWNGRPERLAADANGNDCWLPCGVFG